MQTRPATPANAAAVARIYNAGIEERVATFETRHRSPEDVLPRLDGTYPAVVVTDNGAVVAFAWTSAYSPRDCYSGIADFSVYTAPEARGRGAGKLAMKALIEEARRRGFWKLLSKVFVENTRSLNLLRSLDFREVGVHKNHARLDGAWRDVVVVEALLQENLWHASGTRLHAGGYTPAATRRRLHAGGYNLIVRGVKKENLPEKVCPVCGRPFRWRKKWERDWDSVVYCSARCRKEARSG